MTQPASNSPAIVISPLLMPEEAEALRQSGRDPGDYAAIMAQAAGVQATPGADGTGQKFTVFVITVCIPTSALDLPFSSIADASGAKPISTKAAQAIAAPPLTRFIVSRGVLTEAALACCEPPTDLPGLPPLPLLRRNSDTAN